jgi:hypothetical protein
VRRIAAILVVVAAGACSDDGAAPCAFPLGDGSCAGVQNVRICDGDFCTAGLPSGVGCTRVHHVLADSAGGDGSADKPFSTPGEATARAAAGECIALGPGRYPPFELPAGVSLLGAGADRVSIVGEAAGGSGSAYVLRVDGAGGQAAVVRGIRIEAQRQRRGVLVRGATGLALQDLRVDSARGIGVAVGGATVSVASVEVLKTAVEGDKSPGIGLLAVSGAVVKMSRSIVNDSEGPGVLASESGVELDRVAVIKSGLYGVSIDCVSDSRCTTALASRITGTTLKNNKGVGLRVSGGRLSARENDIAATKVLFHAASQAWIGRGIEIHAADVALERNHVHESELQGIVVDGATGSIVDNRVERCQERGIWVQGISGPAGLTLEDNALTGNHMVGIGVTRSRGVKILGGRVHGTREKTIMSPVGEPQTLGDGLQVLDGSEVEIRGGRVEASKRLGVLIDAARATITDTVVEAALVVQNAALSDQVFERVSDPGGAPVKGSLPKAPYYLDASPIDLVSTSPIPLP